MVLYFMMFERNQTVSAYRLHFLGPGFEPVTYKNLKYLVLASLDWGGGGGVEKQVFLRTVNEPIIY